MEIKNKDMKKTVKASKSQKRTPTVKTKKHTKELVPIYGSTPLGVDGNSVTYEKTFDITPNVKFLNSMRNSGHDNYTAINDLTDNPLDTDVDAKNIRVDIKQSKGEYIFVRISDDGSGMTHKVLGEGLKHGSETGREKETFLGGYGCGGKTAGLSIGKKIEIRTKSKNEPFFIVDYDYDEIQKDENFRVPNRIGTPEEYVEFMKITGSETGTIVTVSRLDQMKNNNITYFTKSLRERMGMTYYYFIKDQGKRFFVNNKEVEPIDPISRELYEISPVVIGEEFEYKGNKFKFSVYNIPFISRNRSEDVGRNKHTAGMYIFRNNRLVSNGIDLGVLGMNPDGYGSGIRVEVFMNGNCDELFGSTFIKIIKEANKYEINQDFRGVCETIIGRHTKKIIKDEKDNAKKRKEDEKVRQENEIKRDTVSTNKYLKEFIESHKKKTKEVDYTIRFENMIADLYGKNSQAYSRDLESAIIDFTPLHKTNPKNNEGDAFLNVKSEKYDLSAEENITSVVRRIFEVKTSYCDTKKNKTFSIVRLKPTQTIDFYIILLVDPIIPKGSKIPINVVGHFYCLPSWYVESSGLFKISPVNGTAEANEGNKNIETRFTIDKKVAYDKFGRANNLRGTSFRDLLDHLIYLNGGVQYLSE